jgi:hypothetical protein
MLAYLREVVTVSKMMSSDSVTAMPITAACGDPSVVVLMTAS